MAEVMQFYAKNRSAWRKWLIANHDKQQAIWLVFDKGSNRTLHWSDIVQEALCFGWVDSTAGKVSDMQSKLYISKRKPKSAWSKINKQHVEKLIAAKLMTPAGQAAIDEAQRNGAWNALDKSDALELPKELQNLMDSNPVAQANFSSFSNSSKRIILEWIYRAKKDETRIKRIEETVKLAKQNIKANHYRQ